MRSANRDNDQAKSVANIATDSSDAVRYDAYTMENWLQTALDKVGMSQAELAREMTKLLGRSIDRAAVNKIALSKRTLKADEAFAIVRLTGAELPETMTSGLPPEGYDLNLGKGVPIPPGRMLFGGKVSAGYFLSVDEFNQDLENFQVPPSIPRHPGYPQLQQTAYLAVGDSMDKAGILDGMWVVAASYADWIDKIGELDNGNRVIVQRTRAGGSEIERTVKEVQFARLGMRLVPRSSNPVHKEFFIDLDVDADSDTEEVGIIGVVLWVGLDMDPRSQR